VTGVQTCALPISDLYDEEAAKETYGDYEFTFRIIKENEHIYIRFVSFMPVDK
jgi:hypothetical protein